MAKRCAHGKLKNPTGRRRCKKAPARRGKARRSSKRRSRRGGRGLKIAGMGVGTLALLGAVGFGAYKLSQGSMLPPPEPPPET